MRHGPWLRGLLGLGILAGVVWWYPVEAFTDAFAVVDRRAVLAALGIGAATTVLSAARWLVVARGVGLQLPLGRAVADYYLAVFLNAVLPAGVLGDAHRAVSHGRYSGDLGRGVRAVVLERVAGQTVLAACVAALLFTLPAALFGPGLQAVGVSAGVVAVVLVAGAVGLRVGRTRRPWWWRTLRVAAQDAWVGVCTRGPEVIVLSLAAVAGHVSLFLVAAYVVGVTAPVLQLVPLVLLALLAMSLPVNAAGWGPREAVAALAFGAAGLGAQTGLTVSVVYGLLALVASLPGAAVLLARSLQRRQVTGEEVGERTQEVAALGGRGQ